MPQIYFKCDANIYLSAQTFVYQPGILLCFPTSILVSLEILFVVRKYFPTPENILLAP